MALTRRMVVSILARASGTDHLSVGLHSKSAISKEVQNVAFYFNANNMSYVQTIHFF